MAITKISSALIGANTIATANIADNAVDGTKIAQNSILTKHIDDAQVTAGQLAADAVITAKILDVNVTTAKIADDAVTLAKMDGLARGKIIYGDASGNPAALALGSNGTVLKSDGTDIAWATDATVAALTSEEVQDIAGAMFSSNTETGITATYQDADGTIDLVVGTLNQDTTGLAGTATALATARAIAVAGAVTGTANFDGSAGISISTTLANNAVLTQHIDDNQITTDQIAANTIATANIADNAVDGTKIASNSILTRHIDDDQITGDQLADAVTFTTSATAPLTVSTTSARISQVAITSNSAAVAWDSTAAANAYHVTTENTTIANPTNSVEGAIISVELAQGGTARTIAWGGNFEFAASTAPTVTATANKTDIFAFRYNGTKWQEIGRVQNLAQS